MVGSNGRYGSCGSHRSHGSHGSHRSHWRRAGHLGRIGFGAQNGPGLCWDWEVETRRKLDFLDLAAGSDHAGAEDVVGIRIPWLRAADILLNKEQSPEPT